MKIIGGQYHAIKYELTDHGNGTASQECSLYTPEHGWHDGKTWELAFSSLNFVIDGNKADFEGLPITKKNL